MLSDSEFYNMEKYVVEITEAIGAERWITISTV